MEKRRRWLGSFSFYRSLFLLVFPIALQQVLSVGMTFFHPFFIGKWAKAYNESVEQMLLLSQIGNRYFYSFQAIIMSISIASSLFLAEAKGKGDKKEMKKVMKCNFLLSFISATAFVIIGLLFQKQFVSSLFYLKNGEKSYFNEALYFYDFLLLSLLPLSITHMLAYLLRNLKQTKYPLLSTLVALLFHIGFSFLLLYGFHVSIVGIAISFFLSRILEMVLLLVFYKKKGKEVKGFIQEKEVKEELMNMVKKGFPVFISQYLQEAIFFLMFFAYARIPSKDNYLLSNIAFVSQIVDVCYALLGGMGTATAIYIAHPLANQEKEEALEKGRYLQTYVFFFSLLLSMLMLVFLPIYEGIVGKNHFLEQIFIMQIISMPFLFISQTLMFIMRSGGYTKSHFYVVILPSLLIKVPFIFVFVFLYPSLFEQVPVFSSFLSFFHLEDNLLTLIFLLDRMLEFLRALIAFFLYHKVQWYEKRLSVKES